MRMAEITINIPDDKINEFAAGFFAILPVPTVNEVPTMTKVEWVKDCIKKRFLFKVYESGKKKLAGLNVQVDQDIIQ